MIQKIRAASCSLVMLLLTLALVTSSLLVARYAVKASSWWLSLLAVTVCLMGLCTWIQLAASRASRWRSLLARHAAQLRRQQPAGGGLGGLGPLAHHGAVAHISGGPLDSPQAQRAHLSPPAPPPYALADLPPSYCAVAVPQLPPGEPLRGLAPSPEPPPSYSEAIKCETAFTEPPGPTLAPPSAPPPPPAPPPTLGTGRDLTDRPRQPYLWF